MYIAISILIVTLVISLMVWWSYALSKDKKQNEGNMIIGKFEPDNIAPTLTDMIEFHKKNGIIDYEIWKELWAI